MKKLTKIQATLFLFFYVSTASAEASNIVYTPNSSVTNIPYPSSLSPPDRDAITRVAIAEANTQGEDGLAGVVFVILNRFKHGGFGSSITEILNAPLQFEPVSTTGRGLWSNLPRPSEYQRTKINTILNLALSGHFQDPTKGSLYFQNPKIVAKREQSGTVSKGLTHFGGATPSVVIKDHAFYANIKTGHKSVPVQKPKQAKNWNVFENSIYQVAHENFKTWAD